MSTCPGEFGKDVIVPFDGDLNVTSECLMFLVLIRRIGPGRFVDGTKFQEFISQRDLKGTVGCTFFFGPCARAPIFYNLALFLKKFHN
jgi:hypothetical protein